MRKPIIFLLIMAMVMISACSQDKPDKTGQTESKESPVATSTGTADQVEKTDKMTNFVLVKGGTFKNTKSNYYGLNGTLSNFYMGKYEVTQKEWTEVMGSNPSQFKGDNLPVEMVSWYDVIEYCNNRSIKEGYKPFYNIDKNTKDPNNKSENDDIKWIITVNAEANGYRLPTEAEWEYAAGGGQMSKSYTYSGSNNPDEVEWYWRNAGVKPLSGDWNWPAIENNHVQTKPVGGKTPNEIGLYDMSGNVREWCWNWYGDLNSDSGSLRVVKGGGWIGDISSSETAFRGKFEANGFGPDQGFRVTRNG